MKFAAKQNIVPNTIFWHHAVFLHGNNLQKEIKKSNDSLTFIELVFVNGAVPYFQQSKAKLESRFRITWHHCSLYLRGNKIASDTFLAIAGKVFAGRPTATRRKNETHPAAEGALAVQHSLKGSSQEMLSLQCLPLP